MTPVLVALAVGLWLYLFGKKMKAVADKKASGASLQQKFVALNPLKGKTKSEIISEVGNPNTISSQAGGKTLLQWMEMGFLKSYHIALLFDSDDICEGVTHQHSA